MPRRKRAEEPQGIVQPSSTKKSKSVANNSVGTNKPVADNIDYERLAQEIVKLQRAIPANVPDLPTNPDVPIEHLSRNVQDDASATQTRNETTQENQIASVITQLLENTAGEPVGTTNDCVNSNHVISLSEGIPLGATVSQKIKAKIWSNEFFDLRVLLSHQEEEPLMLSLNSGVIKVQHTMKSKTPMFISQWTDAFLIFINIRIQKHPSEAPHLLKYISFIREMQRLHGDTAWRTYDESFRKLRESLELAWQKPVEELRGKCISMSQKQNYGQPFRGKTAAKVRFCFAFNQGGKCKNTPCPYSHSCQICSGQHSKLKCSSQTPIPETLLEL